MFVIDERHQIILRCKQYQETEKNVLLEKKDIITKSKQFFLQAPETENMLCKLEVVLVETLSTKSFETKYQKKFRNANDISFLHFVSSTILIPTHVFMP